MRKLPKFGTTLKSIIARRLRQETVMPLAWIAERLQRGRVAYLNNRVHLLGKGKLRE